MVIYPHSPVARVIFSAMSANRSTGTRTVHGLVLMRRRGLPIPTAEWVAERYETIVEPPVIGAVVSLELGQYSPPRGTVFAMCPTEALNGRVKMIIKAQLDHGMYCALKKDTLGESCRPSMQRYQVGSGMSQLRLGCGSGTRTGPSVLRIFLVDLCPSSVR